MLPTTTTHNPTIVERESSTVKKEIYNLNRRNGTLTAM